MFLCGQMVKMGRNQRAEYDGIVRDLGLTIEPGMFGAAGGFASCLDFDSGCEIMSAS